MLETQEFLKLNSFGATALREQFGIKTCYHPTLPLVILNYSQINSPKNHLITRECRALILNYEDWSLVSRSFPRFFNWGEMQEERPLFNWNDCTVTEKVDGSLVQFFYFDHEWHVATRGSFANEPMLNEHQATYFNLPKDFTWKDAVLEALHMRHLHQLEGYLDPSITYVCELCSPWNKVVQNHTSPHLYLLAKFSGETEIKCGQAYEDQKLFWMPDTYQITDAQSIIDFVNNHPESTFEGCVAKDNANRRWKFKNARYLSLHRMKGQDGDALWKPANLFPFILNNESDELLTIYPEVAWFYEECRRKVSVEFIKLYRVWELTKHIRDQKEFALAIKGKTPFTGILFSIRKTGEGLTEKWKASADLIEKVLF